MCMRKVFTNDEWAKDCVIFMFCKVYAFLFRHASIFLKIKVIEKTKFYKICIIDGIYANG